ncbi:MAG TPA: hypothetical protein DHV05_05435 [Acholeplasmataceae bacterium]|nr:hypothetical protein [Acholeplasmataceae bacterium]HBO67905.1 hypothetical protein [Acholeplasmataceae bacterium]HBS02233.1 hypothetical protein [Acholeplasmataceae bacterium]HCB19804.1 hypothetical protein [Acholeplasmataceae bacterium]HCZ24276.1 hypothetical protein [Acholeplasmataceae bacterium]
MIDHHQYRRNNRKCKCSKCNP